MVYFQQTFWLGSFCKKCFQKGSKYKNITGAGPEAGQAVQQRVGEVAARQARNASTFATLAMDAALRQDVLDDLDRFLGHKEYYEGRAWKRGYLIHGPPGTGKSSLVAAISNHLHYDVYDLDLGAVRSNTELRKLLIRMKNRSILLIEDVDCASVAAQRREADGGSDASSQQAPKNHKVSQSEFQAPRNDSFRNL